MTKPIIFLASLFLAGQALAADYIIDKKGMHAAIQFKISHLGYSWLLGRFDDFDGTFTFDPKNLSAAKVNVSIDTNSINSNHAERDKHLRGDDFLNVAKHPKATFVSKSVSGKLEDFKIKGDLTLHGVTKEVTLKASSIGGGKDPWGGYRHGFEASTSFKLKDFGINYNLGPASETVYLSLYVEGIRR